MAPKSLGDRSCAETSVHGQEGTHVRVSGSGGIRFAGKEAPLSVVQSTLSNRLRNQDNIKPVGLILSKHKHAPKLAGRTFLVM